MKTTGIEMDQEHLWACTKANRKKTLAIEGIKLSIPDGAEVGEIFNLWSNTDQRRNHF